MNRGVALRMLAVVIASGTLSHDVQAQSGTRRSRFVQRRSAAQQPAERSEAPTVRMSARSELAVQGIDVVALRDGGSAVPGLVNQTRVFDDQSYRFATGANAEVFSADPARYAPALGGASVVALVDRHVLEAGDARHMRVHGGRLYLFASAQEAIEFDGEPAKYRDADLVLGGLSPVRLVDAGERVAGDPRFERVFQGWRVRCVSETDLQRFLDNPGNSFPTAGGLDPVAVVDSGRFLVGIGTYAAHFKSRLFTFASAENRDRFLSQPADYADLDLARQGNCPVCLVEEGKVVMGKLEISAFHLSRRFLFASLDHRRRFLENPRAFDAPASAGDQASRTPASTAVVD